MIAWLRRKALKFMQGGEPAQRHDLPADTQPRMLRRELSRLLLAGTASAAASGRAQAADDSPWANLNREVLLRVPSGRYSVNSKLRVLTQHTIIGDSREQAMLLPEKFADYVLEIGSGQSGPNAGTIQRLRFFGNEHNLGCLHMNSGSHMWRLDDLLFSGGPCPALVVDNCWDANYTNIDVLAHAGRAADPLQGAAVIFRSGTNNIYCRGLRIEGAMSGGLCIDGSPIYVLGGKIDDGFGTPQSAAAITITPNGYLILDDFYIGGVVRQFQIDTAGSLSLGRVFLDGGSGMAAIRDRRVWMHIDALSFPRASRASMGPEIGILDLGRAFLRRTHPGSAAETAAAVHSRIFPIRQVQQLRITGVGPVSDDTRRISTDLKPAHDDLYRNCFLVHNSTGTHAGHTGGSRRKILRSKRHGDLVLVGSHPVTVDDDWSIEYCAGHFTPIQWRDIMLHRDQTLFANLCHNARIGRIAGYVSDPASAAYGTTLLAIEAQGLNSSEDFRGMYLIDEMTGEPYYIQYGMDANGLLGVIYDCRRRLQTTDTFSICAGYAADISLEAGFAVWRFAGSKRRASLVTLSANGYDGRRFPLWWGESYESESAPATESGKE